MRHANMAQEAPADGGPRVKPEKEKGFVNKMRMVAMKLHTKEQAPAEGGTPNPPPPPQPRVPTLPGYLRFLAESKAVYDTFESCVGMREEYAGFRATGLERSAALAADIEELCAKHSLQAPEVGPDGPGAQYAAKISALAAANPPSFICHFYNFYFAHTAGGRMIGRQLSSMLLSGATLRFYQWEGDVGEHLDAVRRQINALAETWSDAEREECLQETMESFSQSGAVMRCITE